MYWNFGGNFQSVATICQYNEWSKCLVSFVEYIWFEVVTDVADCLANEGVLWTILAMTFVFLTIAYVVYWKLQWAREIKRNKDKIISINYKIEDIELKLDIITYKTRYGSWTSQCLQEQNSLVNAKNYRFALSKVTLENPWIKNLLERADKKKYARYNLQRNRLRNCDEPSFLIADCDKKLPMQADCKEEDDPSEYDLTCRKNFGAHSGLLFQRADNKQSYSLIIPPESNLIERSKNHILYLNKDIEVSNSNLSRRKSITMDNPVFGQRNTACNNDLKVIASSTNMTEFSRATLGEFQGKNYHALSEIDHPFSKSHDTLFEVQQKLTTLYRTIHSYNMRNSVVPMLTPDSNSNCIQISRASTCNVDECIGGSLFEESNRFVHNSNETQDIIGYSNCTTNEIEPTALNTTGMENYSNRVICNNAGNYINCTSQDNKIAANSGAEKNEIDTNSQVLQFHSAVAVDTEILSEYDTVTKASEGLNISKVDIQNSEVDDKEEYNLDESGTSSDSSLKQDNMKFGSTVLDMITEESSLSSCAEIKSDVHHCNIEEKNIVSQDKTSVSNEESKQTHLKIDQLSHEKVKKQKEVNCVSNTESSRIRKFSSTFSSFFLLCNEQDGNQCQPVHDDSMMHDDKSSQNFISLTESSSDVSVSQSITEFVDNERILNNSDRPPDDRKMIADGSTRHFEVSEEAKVRHSTIDSTNDTTNSHNPLNSNQTKREPSLDEASKYKGVECLREMKNVAKKLIDSVLDMKYKDHDRPKIQSNNRISPKSSETQFKSCEINDLAETRNVDSIINKYESHSDSFANKKCMEWNSSQMKRYDTLHWLKEMDDTLNVSSIDNTQKTAMENLDYIDCKVSKARSYSDLTAFNKRQLLLFHRRSRSYVNSREITDKCDYNTETDCFFEPSSAFNNKLSDTKSFSNSISDDSKDALNIKKSKSCGLFYSKSPSNSIQKLNFVEEKPIVDTMTTSSSKRSCSENDSSLEPMPLLLHSSIDSCVPITKNRGTVPKDEQTILANSTDLSINVLLEKETQDLKCQVVADLCETCSSSTDKDNAYFQECINLTEFENLKNFERNAIEYYNLISDNRMTSNCPEQKNLTNTVVEEPNVLGNVAYNQENSTSFNSFDVKKKSATCLLSKELSEQNPLNSLIFQNALTSISPYKIEKKETEVLVKPSTLDMSTSMTNFQSTYYLDESNNLNDVKIFEVSDELTKEECIRYLQMFDQDSNHDQSTNTYDFSDHILENI